MAKQGRIRVLGRTMRVVWANRCGYLCFLGKRYELISNAYTQPIPKDNVLLDL